MPESARLRVIRPGLLTTVQDLGRFGYQRWGVPVSGAMDPVAFALANRLVGNPDGAAGLEITLQGPELLFETPAVVSITGADLSPVLDGTAVPNWTTLRIDRGSTLKFGTRRSGARAYLAIAGGADVPLVLGSRSTHVRNRMGGLEGRALVKGDVIMGRRPAREPAVTEVQQHVRPAYRAEPLLRIIPGPQADLFEPEALRALTDSAYRVSAESDRMGYRLEGPRLGKDGSTDIVSDATPRGAIQVSSGGKPLLLMADRQTTGGYAKIAVLITADMPLAAQLMPGDTLRFSLAEPAEARRRLHEQDQRLAGLLPTLN